MSMKRAFIPVILTALFCSTCKNDLVVIDEWKETTVVYGLLNQGDTAQYIKINKAFLGEGNALQMAQVYDSSTYGNYLDVTLQRVKNGVTTQTIIMQRDSSVLKNSGTFYAPDQVLYKTTSPLFDDSEYLLTVTNKKTSHTVTSKTPLVADFSFGNPTTSSGSLSFTNPTNPFKVYWTSTANGRLYQLVIRFHWSEILKQDTTQITQHSVDWVFPTQKSQGLGGGEAMEEKFLGAEFYKFLQTHISPNNTVYRVVGGLDFIVSVAADDFNTYMEVNRPSTSVVQERPEFSNIKNGIGIFSARYVKIIPNKLLGQKSEDSVYAGQYTWNLNFCSKNPTSPWKCN